ncbi:type I methionyl aminopeptidase [Archangium violaceum]|uniref:type I methionyl aminopeptidase n=1 Tax=Archangium violaceum TaxID=83451 RepID=UPI002B31A3BA|nr:type I methionyl aminopeptidase [Archangium violaceum]
MSTSITPVLPPAKLPGPNEPCWCGSGTKYKKCHRGEDSQARAPVPASRRVKQGVVSPRRPVPPHIPRPDYAETGRPGPGVKGDPATRLERMRRACRAAAEVLQVTGAALRPGVTTDAIDAIAHEEYIRRGGYPSTLNYHGFPKSLCTSVNEVILHGIPDSRPLEDGDIVNLDITIYLDGMHGDCSATFPVGKIDSASEQLLRVTRECMMLGIEAIRPGLPINVIGRAIEAHASRYGYGVVRSYCGHGIGEVFHLEPQVCHYFDPRATDIIEEGMFFTVEPMLTMGSIQHQDWDDDWTVVTADGRRSAQFEHTIHVTRDGAEILTRLEG